MIKWAQRAPKRYRVMKLIASGLTIADVAERMGTAESTVTKHIELIRDKIGARNSKINSAFAFRAVLDGGNVDDVRIYLSRKQMRALYRMLLMLLRGADVKVAVRNKEFVEAARVIINTWVKTSDVESIE